MNLNLMFSNKQTEQMRISLLNRFNQILDTGEFIFGKEVHEIEDTLAKHAKVNFAIGCANGTDALTLALMALDLKAGEVVFTTSFTFIAPAEAICLLGGIPYFIDIKAGEFNMCPKNLEESIIDAKKLGLKARGIISVDLFGHPVDYKAIKAVADKHNLFFIADCAQSFGAKYDGNPVGSLADISTTSFFPTKPLGCYGDGGMMFTNNKQTAEVLRSLIFHGKGTDKYNNVRVGMNSRLDTLQAAVLLEKMTTFATEIKQRDALAQFYNQELTGYYEIPKVAGETSPVWAVYSLMHPKRNEVMEALKAYKIPNNIYYRVPTHKQPAYEQYPKSKSMEQTDLATASIFAIPMHAYINEEERNYITKALKEIANKVGK